MKHIRTFLRKKKKKFKNIIYHSPNPTRTHAHPTSLISERLQLPRDKDNWKQKWRAKSKNFISKQNTGSLSLSLSVSHCACACVSVRKMETQAAEEPVRTKMESLRLTCEREIQIHQQKIDSYASSFRNSLQSIKSRAQQTAQNQGLLHDDVLFFCFFLFQCFLLISAKLGFWSFWVWDSVSFAQIRVFWLRKMSPWLRNFSLTLLLILIV